jgi:hypothetical protein
MSDVIEVSYTGDLLAHRRCRRAWAYEKRAGFHPYEVVQAMEGRLVHHAMEWLTRQHQEALGRRRHATEAELRAQLEHYFRVLWARGIRTTFASKQETIDRVVGNLYPGGRIDPVVKAVIEGAQHTEYELRAVKKVLPADAASFSGKSRILLTGILDLVIQQRSPLTYQRWWVWDSVADLRGHVEETMTTAATGEVEIWDYKGTRANSPFVDDTSPGPHVRCAVPRPHRSPARSLRTLLHQRTASSGPSAPRDRGHRSGRGCRARVDLRAGTHAARDIRHVRARSRRRPSGRAGTPR